MKTLLLTITTLVILLIPQVSLAQDVIDYTQFNVDPPAPRVEPPAVISPTFDWRWLLLPIALLPLLYLIFRDEDKYIEEEYFSNRNYAYRPVYQDIQRGKKKKTTKSKPKTKLKKK